jgi:hypothetical protein
MQIGIPEDRFDRVVGKAATEPLVADNPTHPSNRRLSLIMLRGTGKDNPVTKSETGGKPGEPEALPGLNKIRNEQAEPAPTPKLPTTIVPSQQKKAPPGGAALPSLGLELDKNIAR